MTENPGPLELTEVETSSNAGSLGDASLETGSLVVAVLGGGTLSGTSVELAGGTCIVAEEISVVARDASSAHPPGLHAAVATTQRAHLVVL